MSKNPFVIIGINVVVLILLCVGISVLRGDATGFKYVPPFTTDASSVKIPIEGVDSALSNVDDQALLSIAFTNFLIKANAPLTQDFVIDSQSVFYVANNEYGASTNSFVIKSKDNKLSYAVKTESVALSYTTITISGNGTTYSYTKDFHTSPNYGTNLSSGNSNPTQTQSLNTPENTDD